MRPQTTMPTSLNDQQDRIFKNQEMQIQTVENKIAVLTQKLNKTSHGQRPKPLEFSDYEQANVESQVKDFEVRIQNEEGQKVPCRYPNVLLHKVFKSKTSQSTRNKSTSGSCDVRMVESLNKQ